MIIAYTFISLFIAWIWVDYYRLVDIFEKERFGYIILTFALGCTSVFITFGINRLFFDGVISKPKDDFTYDLLYYIFVVGLVEEVSKLTPFLIIFFFFRKEVNEPIDFIVYACVSALGFSAVENVLYFNRYGAEIITARAIKCSLGHMFYTAIVAYSIMRYYYHPRRPHFFSIILFLLFAAFLHGFNNFGLTYPKDRFLLFPINLFNFYASISVFATIINNALNNSDFFTYKRVVDSEKVAKRLLLYYAAVLVIQFILLSIQFSVIDAMLDFMFSILTICFIIMIACLRLSRFKLIKDRWFPLKYEMPFKIKVPDGQFKVMVKGDTSNEVVISRYFNEYFLLNSFNRKKSYLKNKRYAYLEEKLFLEKDDAYFLARVYTEPETGEYEELLLRSKATGNNLINGEFPIVAVLKIDHLEDIYDPNLTKKDFKFLEWGVVHPLPEEE